MQDFISIVDVLQNHAKNYPNRTAIKFLTQKGYEKLTYSELDTQAKKLAQALKNHAPFYNERAIILLPPGLNYIIAFFACLYSGVIAVPVYPPRKNQHKNRVFAILEDSQAKFVITNQSLASEFSNYIVINTDEINEEEAQAELIEPNKIAFLQYTSGSTNTPKGVLITHQNLIANIQAIMKISPLRSGVDKICSWLPPYHDMGLIGCILTPIYERLELISMSPTYFLHSPTRWFEIISKEQVTATCVPNFAFDYCVKKITTEQINQLDLSCLKCIYNGSEPIQFNSIQRFLNKFQTTGLKPEAIYPCYGLAEATLMLTAKKYHVNNTLKLIKSDFELRKVTIASEETTAQTLHVVNCGHCAEGHYLRIIEPNTLNELPELSIGEIWANGPSISRGYWKKEELTQATFQNTLAHAPDNFYLRTGDLGFIYNKNLYVTGRIKDLIIFCGKNYYPQDIEQAIAQNNPAFEPQGAAAFSLEINGQHELIFLQELTREAINTTKNDLLLSDIRATLLDQFGLVPHAVVLVKPFSLPKTSSGKIQRWLARIAFLNNTLKNIACWENKALLPLATPLVSSSDDVKYWLTNWLTRRLNMSLSTKDYDKSIAALGINSIAAVELANELESKLDKKIELLPLFEQYSLNQLISSLADNFSHASTSWGTNTIQEPDLLKNKSSQKINTTQLADPLTHYLGAKSEHSGEKESYLFISNLKKIYFNLNEGISTNTTLIEGKQYTNYSGYNYLGLSGNPIVTQAVIDAVKKFGTSVSASRLVSGEKSIHVALENAIADLIGTEACLVFPSGYATNVAIITHLFGKKDLIIHDELAHNSILQAAMFSGAERIAFPHNNYQFLTNFLQKYRDQYNKVLIVTEGIFSMDGDIPDIPQLITIKKQFHSFLMIDEAHSIGVLGQNGRGISEYFNLNPKDVDIWMGTLSKSFASCGGYVAGSQELIENFKYTAAGFVYSAGISPANTAAALAAIEVMNQDPQRLHTLRERHSLLLLLLKAQNIATGLSHHTPIIPIIVGENAAALQLSHYLKEHAILALPIIYPAVEKNLARVRLFINCLHTEEQIYHTVNVLKQKDFGKNKSKIDTLVS